MVALRPVDSSPKWKPCDPSIRRRNGSLASRRFVAEKVAVTVRPVNLSEKCSPCPPPAREVRVGRRALPRGLRVQARLRDDLLRGPHLRDGDRPERLLRRGTVITIWSEFGYSDRPRLLTGSIDIGFASFGPFVSSKVITYQGHGFSCF